MILLSIFKIFKFSIIPNYLHHYHNFKNPTFPLLGSAPPDKYVELLYLPKHVIICLMHDMRSKILSYNHIPSKPMLFIKLLLNVGTYFLSVIEVEECVFQGLPACILTFITDIICNELK